MLKNLTERQVAQRMGLSVENYKMVESDELIPSFYRFEKLINYLDLDMVAIREIIGRTIDEIRSKQS